MDNKHSLRAMPIIAFARKFALIFMFICSFSFNSIVFGADYIFNGETLPATSNYQDIYYGVETMKNILDDLEITYDDTTILGYTYYANKALEDFRTNYDENATPLNIIFSKNSTNILYMTPSNGTFDDDLKYLFLLPEYSGTEGKIYACNEEPGETPIFSASRTRTMVLSSSNYYYQNDGINFLKNAEADYQEGGSLYFKYILSPIETYTVAGQTTATGTTWYFLTNTIEFTKALDIDIPSGDTQESGDTGGGTGGDYSGQLNQIQGTLNNIENKIPTSGDMQGILSNETDKVINFMSGDANFNKEYTSEEILERIDFEPIENPYANFWLELTNILNNALTGTSNGYYMNWFGKNYLVTTDMIIPEFPGEFKIILATISTTALVITMAKWIKIITDKTSSGSVDELLEMSEEEIVNLF